MPSEFSILALNYMARHPGKYYFWGSDDKNCVGHGKLKILCTRYQKCVGVIKSLCEYIKKKCGVTHKK